MRKAEFEEWFNGKEFETFDSVSDARKHFIGVSRNGDKWRAQTQHPKLKVSVHLGYYSSPEEAALAVKKKKAEFEEMLKADDCLSMESVGKSTPISHMLGHNPTKTVRDKLEGRKHCLGVSKSGNRWQARVRHPKLKVDVYCGRYSTPEEAAFVVNEKKAEFEEMFKSEHSTSMKSFRDQFGRKKLPYGVTWENGRYHVRIWQPELKKYVLLGSYSTCEEATIVANIKRAEFRDDEVLQEAESEVASKSEFSDELTGYVKVPRGVTRKKSGKWVARTKDPVSRSQIWLGTYNTVEEAVRSFNMKKAEFAVRTKRAEFDEVNDEVLQVAESEVASVPEFSGELTGDVKVPCGVTRIKSGKWVARIRDPVSRSQIWLGTYNTTEEAIRSFNKKKVEFAVTTERAESDGSKANEGPVKFGCELGYDSPTLSLGADDLNNIAGLGDKSNCGVVDIPGKLGDGLVSSSPSVFDPENSNSASVSDKTCGLDFDRAVSLGFINEYGQLLGKFSELDENMGLGFRNENVAATGYY